MVVVRVRGATYHMDDKLVTRWDKLKDGRLAKYDEDRFYVVDGAEGCLAGDTQIQCSRGKLSRRYSIQTLYNHYHKIANRGKLFDLKIPTFVRSFNGKEIILHKIKDVMYSGKKLIYLMKLKNGKNIKATATHKFLTRSGWKPLSKLKVGDELMCDNLNVKKNKRKNNFSQSVPVFNKIKSIKELEVEDVYDIACEEPHHNFVANGIVVHNSGKSLFTLQQAAYIDPTILDDVDGEVLPRICFSVQAFLDAIKNNKSTQKHTKVIIFDEAFRGLSSKASLSKNNKLLVTALMEARQNNLIVFLVTPSFYLLEFYAAVLRSQALFHIVKEKKTRRRYVRVFNKKDKAILYQIGVRKGWGYPRKTKFRVKFFNIYPGGDMFEKRYRKKKSDNFGQEDSKSKSEIAYFEKSENLKSQRDILLLYIKQTTGLSYQKISSALKKMGFNMTPQVIGMICSDEAYKINKDKPLVPSKDLAEEDLSEKNDSLPRENDDLSSETDKSNENDDNDEDDDNLPAISPINR